MSSNYKYFLAFLLYLLVQNVLAQEYYEVLADRVSVMSSPLPEGDVVGSLNQHDVIEVTSACQGWARVLYKGRTAYVPYQSLSPLGQGVPFETESLETWIKPRREGPPLTKKELEQQRKAEEKAARQTIPKVKVGEMMTLLNYNLDPHQVGVTLAYASQLGFYLRGMFLGGTPESSYKSNDRLYTALYKKDSANLFTLTGGAMYRVTTGVFAYAGTGYGHYGHKMNASGDYDYVMGAEGLIADVGVVVNLGHFLLQGGYNAILGDNDPSGYNSFYLGLGYSFDIKKRR